MQQSPLLKRVQGLFEFLNFREEELFPELNNGCEGRGPERRKGWDHSCGWMLRNQSHVQANWGFRGRPQEGKIPHTSSLFLH